MSYFVFQTFRFRLNEYHLLYKYLHTAISFVPYQFRVLTDLPLAWLTKNNILQARDAHLSRDHFPLIYGTHLKISPDWKITARFIILVEKFMNKKSIANLYYWGIIKTDQWNSQTKLICLYIFYNSTTNEFVNDLLLSMNDDGTSSKYG